jgi:hypothetical protein
VPLEIGAPDARGLLFAAAHVPSLVLLLAGVTIG